MKRTFRTKQDQGTYFKNGFPNEKKQSFHLSPVPSNKLLPLHLLPRQNIATFQPPFPKYINTKNSV